MTKSQGFFPFNVNLREQLIRILVEVLSLGKEQGSTHIQVQVPQHGVKCLQQMGQILGQSDVLGVAVCEHLGDEGLLGADSGTRREHGVGLGHGWVTVPLL